MSKSDVSDLDIVFCVVFNEISIEISSALWYAFGRKRSVFRSFGGRETGMEKQGAKHFLFRILCGFLLGISIVGPGISGSVIAILLGIYGKLIAIAANPFKKIKETVIYLFPMGIGAGISFVLFVKLVDYLLENFTTPAYLLFIALMIGSIPAIYQKASAGPIKGLHIAVCVGAFLAAAAFGLLEQSHFAFTVDTANIFYLSLSGFIAGAVSVVPGMSVSLVLMLLGVFETLYARAAAYDVLTMAPVGICFLVGLVLLSRVIKHIFEAHSGLAYFAVLGFMTGSIVGIVPDLPSGTFEWVLSAVLFAGGLALSSVLGRLAKTLRVEEQPAGG